jgi:hypothetical protein
MVQADDTVFVEVTGENHCRALLDRTGVDARPYMGIFDYLL